MPTFKKKYSDDDDSVEEKEIEEDESMGKKPSKKQRTEEKSTNKGDGIFSIGRDRKVSVSDFKGKKYINIREYYTDKSTGEEKPGKKGIALTVEQWESLKEKISEIDSCI
mmetsp:Transcript_11265/g.11301  ORF Transcript_11265/g.11301 Transcript_11265/m.11301 type:complete len:110 (+) Transcript_11265:80-409(+)|eukprot:CAMPEP_0182427452 /NCGR_PEP_ID=MMETSP1167-20130531/17187_1 /TAXON_ID=2988 /ORGANISM="Mallomonas Sp, Strain CCMP3275" /LENGTH=109 /DNA_ID=CAMNT_0024609689 /DNA_START=42 /DNA_END=371 /DNA_ORIENTATION=+